MYFEFLNCSSKEVNKINNVELKTIKALSLYLKYEIYRL